MNRALFSGLLFFSIVGIAGISNAVDLDDFKAATFVDSSGFQMPYRLFVPPDYDSNRSYPIVLFLHGAAGCGTDNQKHLSNANQHGSMVWVLPENQAKSPAFILAPQASVGKLAWGVMGLAPSASLQAALELMDYLEGVFPIDVRREYVTGQSIGGIGTWAALTTQPVRFAAGVPLSGGGDPSVAAKIAHIPQWIFHGSLDTVVPPEHSRQIVDSLLASGDEPRYTEYGDAAHGISKTVYHNPDLHEWLFAQAKPLSTPLGDFNRSGVLDITDLELLVEAIDATSHRDFDINRDDQIDNRDLFTWITDLKKTWLADVNLDGQFDSSDLVKVFEAGKYETDQKAVWTEGDWNFDNRFEAGDIVAAFVEGGFEKEPRQEVVAVPESISVLPLIVVALMMLRVMRHRRDSRFLTSMRR